MAILSLKAHTHSFKFGDNTVTLNTGEMARQATGAVMIDMDGTSVLVTVVGIKKANPQATFFPLTVNYQEKTYAAGKIPGGFFKREGRPSERETLIARLIDRPIRPLFPEGFMNEVQIVAQVVSLNPEVNPDIVSMIGASAALALSGIPFEGPIAGARVGYVGGHFVLNPSEKVLETSDLDLVVAGTDTSVLMVESEANQLPEDIMLEAVMFGHHHLRTAIEAIKVFAKDVAKPKWDWTPVLANPELVQLVKDSCATEIANAYLIADKTKRQDTLAALLEDVLAKLVVGDEPKWTKDAVSVQFEEIERAVVRGRILEGEPRIDGRDTETVRPITSRVSVLPRTHGSALFTRGETQALVVATVGTGRDAQTIDKISGEAKDTFMLHYNFPPFCVGETGMIGSPKRREIGHGRLAKRGIQAVMPDQDAYPYVVRVVSEVLESNGSSSMATVCGTSLALMDAGVPISAPVAGIAMGLIKNEDSFAVLTDILGDEDHLGDMDFKVAGTNKGVTALQMDIKINGITREIMEVALDQAKAGRLHILGCMARTMTTPRTEMSEFAPRMITFTIRQDKIRDVIGKGGATIRGLTEEFGASIEISDDGRISLVAADNATGEAVQRRIEELTAEVEVGRIYDGKVNRIVDFGAFVNILPGRDGLVHISQICEERVNDVNDKLTEGEIVRVKVLEIDKQGRIRLTMRDLDPVSETAQSSDEHNA